MQPSHFSTEETRCRNGCLVIVRWLVIHVAVLRALLAFVPPALLGVFCLYLTGVLTGSEVSATAISHALGEVSHDTVTRFLTGAGGAPVSSWGPRCGW